MTMVNEDKRETITTDEWVVKRHAIIDEVFMSDGSIRYQVKIWDEGRETAPFVKQWFSDEAPATGFLNRVKGTGKEYVAQEGSKG